MSYPLDATIGLVSIAVSTKVKGWGLAIDRWASDLRSQIDAAHAR
jgi:hypothetical protein